MVIVQIGTCRANDDVSKLVKSGIEIHKLILVEPMKIHNEKILECYKDTSNFYLENVAITIDDNKQISFYYHQNDGPFYEVASTDINHITKHGYTTDGIIELQVEAIKINQLFEKYQLYNIDVLFIDAEGLDDSIIKTIDFEKYNLSKIYFEYLHLKNLDIYDFLISKGYDIIRDSVNYQPNGHIFVGWSSLAIKKD